jgi:hypothetical protein
VWGPVLVKKEKTLSEMEDKVEELDQSVKDDGKILWKYEWNMRDLWDSTKTPNMNHRCRRTEKRYKLNA